MTDRELRKRKKQLLLSIKSDIKKLDNYIKVCSNDGFSEKSVVNAKVFLIKLRAIYPYIVSVFCSTCFSFFVLDDIPFFVNDIKKRQYIKSEIDSLGNSSFSYQYEKFVNDKDSITYYSDCFFSDDVYNRNYVVYSLDDSLFDGFDNIDFSNLNVLYDGIEVSDSVASYDSYIKYTSYSVSDDFYIVRESDSHNELFTIYWLLFTFACELVVLYFRSYISNFDYYSCIQDIYRHYLPNGTDIDVIKEILNNKIENYKLLVRKK